MKTLQIEHQGQEYEMTLERHLSRISGTASLFVTLWKWGEEENDWLLLSRGYHMLATEFDALVSLCVEHFGENFDYEKLALENDIQICSFEWDEDGYK